MEDGFMKTWQECCDYFSVNTERGLSQDQVKKAKEKYGPNELPAEEGKSLLTLVLEQFDDLLVKILLLAAVISFVLAFFEDDDGSITAFVEPFVILLILIANAIVGVWQERNAESAIEALKEYEPEMGKVIRADKEGVQKIRAKEIVPGDIVEISVGDKIPADIRIIAILSTTLRIDQSILTGESVSVIKHNEPVPDPRAVNQDKKNIIFSGTNVAAGKAVGVVIGTGLATAIGRISTEMKETEEIKTPLQQKLDEFGEQLSKVITLICIAVWAINIGHFNDPAHGGSWVKGAVYYFKIAVALAVAAIPEGLPAVITTCLALGTRKMAENNCIVRRLPSVETLGCTSVICSDKTGTLTQNLMSACKFGYIMTKACDFAEFDVEEKAYSPEPMIPNFGNIMKHSANAKTMALVCALNSRAVLEYKDSAYHLVGQPTEGALSVLAEKLGNSTGDVTVSQHEKTLRYKDYLNSVYETVATLDFSSKRKTMSTVVKQKNKEGNIVLLKGAFERVLDRCVNLRLDNGDVCPLEDQMVDDITKALIAKAREGYRIVGVAVGPDGGNMKHITAQNRSTELADSENYVHFEGGLCFVGYTCIKDPCRPEVKQSIVECKTAGINVIMITGDAKETAVAIAQELNIVEPGQNIQKTCFTGAEFEALTTTQKKNILKNTQLGKVFSRVEPRHKRELVKLLIDLGEIVAMTGDGVNDAPALKQAHIGVAMGITGTEVAKQASDMVLADDNFSTIVKAVEEGRSIYSNMQAFIRYLISSNIGEVLSIFFTAMLGIPEGFNSVQLLWVNLVTDGPPATALGFNPSDRDIMQKPPRRADDPLINGWVFFRYMVVGTYVGLATVGIFIYWYTMAETADGHTLVTIDQLMNWSECPTWENFTVHNYHESFDFSENPCDYFLKGKAKASCLSLSVLVLIEMLNALNAISADASLLQMNPSVNPYLLAAIANSMLLHAVILYVPVMNEIFSITSLNQEEWMLVIAFSAPVLLCEEVLKIVSRRMNAAELQQRLEDNKKVKKD